MLGWVPGGKRGVWALTILGGGPAPGLARRTLYIQLRNPLSGSLTSFWRRMEALFFFFPFTPMSALPSLQV